jgi:hypothetical protein
MTSKVQIAKMALQHIGDRYDITSLDEASTEAEQVNLMYDATRDKLLRMHPWTFSTKFTTPAPLVVAVPSRWDYAFAYPSDCLKVVEITQPLGPGHPPVKFRTGTIATTKVVMCDLDEPEIQYIFKNDDPVTYDPSFVMAFSYMLAAYVAIPLTGDRGLKSDLMREAMAEVDVARQEDANEGVEDEKFIDPDWIRARL